MSSKETNGSNTSFRNIFAVIAKVLLKIGPKLGKVLSGLFKSGAIVKTAGAAASAGLYSYLFTWQMGLALVAFIFVHEYGHLYAMKKCGIATKGIYLIPGLGAAAIATEKFRSGRNEAYIALNGPFWGLWFVVACIVAYFFTADLLFLSIASMMTFINLLNLFPVNPLDGGRVVKAILYSLSSSFAFFAMIVLFIGALYASWRFGYLLLALIAFLGISEIISDYGLGEKLRPLIQTVYRILLFWFCFVLLGWFLLWSGSIAVIVPLVLSALVICAFLIDVYSLAERYGRSKWSYLWSVIIEGRNGLSALFFLKKTDLVRIDGHETMMRSEVAKYSAEYLILIATHVIFLLAIAMIPGMELAKEILQ